MFVTAAPYTIKGAAFDCFGDAILERGVTAEIGDRKGERLEKGGASPLLASDARVLPT